MVYPNLVAQYITHTTRKVQFFYIHVIYMNTYQDGHVDICVHDLRNDLCMLGGGGLNSPAVNSVLCVCD